MPEAVRVAAQRLRFVVGEAEAGQTLAALLRQHMPGVSWSDVRRFVETAKVQVGGVTCLESAGRPSVGQEIAYEPNAPKPRAARAGFRIVHEDGHIVIIEKPQGFSSVPFDRKETNTAMDLLREAWRHEGRAATKQPLYVVHRLDKDTSGLLCFAKTKLAERGMHTIFKGHLAERQYIAVVHGVLGPRRFASELVANRGDGIRGSTSRPGQGEGQHAITHVVKTEPAGRATLCHVRLETGRTHQIRIHLSEAGHPLVGETVYIRDWWREGREALPSTRLLLHAATLGFDHPVTGQRLMFASDLPADFEAALELLRDS